MEAILYEQAQFDSQPIDEISTSWHLHCYTQSTLASISDVKLLVDFCM
jgi:hypothetical protein